MRSCRSAPPDQVRGRLCARMARTQQKRAALCGPFLFQLQSNRRLKARHQFVLCGRCGPQRLLRALDPARTTPGQVVPCIDQHTGRTLQVPVDQAQCLGNIPGVFRTPQFTTSACRLAGSANDTLPALPACAKRQREVRGTRPWVLRRAPRLHHPYRTGGIARDAFLPDAFQ
jgi:hypothetical protein